MGNFNAVCCFLCSMKSNFIPIYWSISHVWVSWTWACIIVKFSSAGRSTAEGLSAACCLCLGDSSFTVISKAKHGAARAKWQHRWHEKQNPDCSLWLIHLPYWAYGKKKNTNNNLSVHLSLCLHFLDTVSSWIERFEHLMKNWISSRNDKCGPTTLLEPNQSSCPAHPSLLSLHLQ